MKLIITDPIVEDYKSFYPLISEPDWLYNFNNFRNMTLSETKAYFENWVQNKELLFPQFLKLIKLTFETDIVEFNDKNSTTIGFISHTEALPNEKLNTGKTHLMNFAIGKNFYGKGNMTNALKMTIEDLNYLGINQISTIVKYNRFACERVLIKCGFILDQSNGENFKVYTYSFNR